MLALDHIVFNTRDRMDEVVALFQRFGFTVAPRGHHTLGSINHVIVFCSDYLELLGYPPGAPPAKRPELASHPIGLMATVLATPDADATRAELIARGLAPRPVQSFSRPVDLGNGTQADAAFRVTRLEPDAVPGTWFYYCQHLTPELVWRREWQQHANGAAAICAVEICVPSVSAALPRYRQCTQSNAPDHAPETVGASHYSAILPLSGCAIQLREAPGPAQMHSLGFRVPSLAPVIARLRAAAIGYAITAQTLTIDPAATFGATLQFIASAY